VRPPLLSRPPLSVLWGRGFWTSLRQQGRDAREWGSNMKEEPRKTVVVIYCHTHVHTGFTSATVPCSHPQPPRVWACTHTPLPLSGGRLPLPSAPPPLGEACSEQFGGGRLPGLTGLEGRRYQLWAMAALIVWTEAEGPARASGGGS